MLVPQDELSYELTWLRAYSSGSSSTGSGSSSSAGSGGSSGGASPSTILASGLEAWLDSVVAVAEVGAAGGRASY